MLKCDEKLLVTAPGTPCKKHNDLPKLDEILLEETPVDFVGVISPVKENSICEDDLLAEETLKTDF